MPAVLEKTTRTDQRIAKGTIDTLKKASRKLTKKGKSIEITISIYQQSLLLPTRAFELLIEILDNMAAGKSMMIASSDASIGTQEAADFLKVSRPHVVRLMENGEIPFTKAGTHRRVKINDLFAYQKRLAGSRKKHLNFLAKQAQELDLGYTNE